MAREIAPIADMVTEKGNALEQLQISTVLITATCRNTCHRMADLVVQLTSFHLVRLGLRKSN